MSIEILEVRHCISLDVGNVPIVFNKLCGAVEIVEERSRCDEVFCNDIYTMDFFSGR